MLDLYVFSLFQTLFNRGSVANLALQASSRNLHKPLPPRLSHELHLPPLLAIFLRTNDNNDHQSLFEKDSEPRLKS